MVSLRDFVPQVSADVESDLEPLFNKLIHFYEQNRPRRHSEDYETNDATLPLSSACGTISNSLAAWVQSLQDTKTREDAGPHLDVCQKLVDFDAFNKATAKLKRRAEFSEQQDQESLRCFIDAEVDRRGLRQRVENEIARLSLGHVAARSPLEEKAPMAITATPDARKKTYGNPSRSSQDQIGGAEGRPVRTVPFVVHRDEDPHSGSGEEHLIYIVKDSGELVQEPIPSQEVLNVESLFTTTLRWQDHSIIEDGQVLMRLQPRQTKTVGVQTTPNNESTPCSATMFGLTHVPEICIYGTEIIVGPSVSQIQQHSSLGLVHISATGENFDHAVKIALDIFCEELPTGLPCIVVVERLEKTTPEEKQELLGHPSIDVFCGDIICLTHRPSTSAVYVHNHVLARIRQPELCLQPTITEVSDDGPEPLMDELLGAMLSDRPSPRTNLETLHHLVLQLVYTKLRSFSQTYTRTADLSINSLDTIAKHLSSKPYQAFPHRAVDLDKLHSDIDTRLFERRTKLPGDALIPGLRTQIERFKRAVFHQRHPGLDAAMGQVHQILSFLTGGSRAQIWLRGEAFYLNAVMASERGDSTGRAQAIPFLNYSFTELSRYFTNGTAILSEVDNVWDVHEVVEDHSPLSEIIDWRVPLLQADVSVRKFWIIDDVLHRMIDKQLEPKLLADVHVFRKEIVKGLHISFGHGPFSHCLWMALIFFRTELLPCFRSLERLRFVERAIPYTLNGWLFSRLADNHGDKTSSDEWTTMHKTRFRSACTALVLAISKKKEVLQRANDNNDGHIVQQTPTNEANAALERTLDLSRELPSLFEGNLKISHPTQWMRKAQHIYHLLCLAYWENIVLFNFKWAAVKPPHWTMLCCHRFIEYMMPVQQAQARIRERIMLNAGLESMMRQIRFLSTDEQETRFSLYDLYERAADLAVWMSCIGPQVEPHWRPRIYMTASLPNLGGPRSFRDCIWTMFARAKAQSMASLLRMTHYIPAHKCQSLDASLQHLLEEERQLVFQLNTMDPDVSLKFIAEDSLATLRDLMRRVPQLQRLMAQREHGIRIERIFTGYCKASDVVIVNWMPHRKGFVMAALRPHCEQSSPTFWPIDVSSEAIERWSTTWNTSRKRKRPQALEEFQAHLSGLIAPLSQVSLPEDILVLSPTGSMCSLPLHALKIGDETLIDRNPVTYASSLDILMETTLRLRERSTPASVRLAMYADPTDTEGGRVVSSFLDDQLGAEDETRRPSRGIYSGSEVTHEHFGKAASCSMLFYHGHAVYETEDFLDRGLLLSGHRTLQARQVFGLNLQKAPLVSLIACASGQQMTEVQDEPLGIVPSFLYAGASNVVAPLWPVLDGDGVEFSKSFIRALLAESKRLGPAAQFCNAARALRQAVLELKAKPQYTERMYHWAGYVLQGSPFCSKLLNHAAEDPDASSMETTEDAAEPEECYAGTDLCFARDATLKPPANVLVVEDKEETDFIVYNQFGDITCREANVEKPGEPIWTSPGQEEFDRTLNYLAVERESVAPRYRALYSNLRVPD